MDNSDTIIFAIFGLLVGLFATAGYGLMSAAQYRGARVAFGATALFFAAIGVELGLVMALPLPAKILIAGCFGFAAAGALVYAFHSVLLLEKPPTKAESKPQLEAPKAYIIADCYNDYLKTMPINGEVYALIKQGNSVVAAIVAGTPGQELNLSPPKPRPDFSRAYRCDLSVKGDLPLFNVTLVFKMNINEFFYEKTAGGYSGHSGKFIESKPLSVSVRKLDVYPTSYSVYVVDQSGFWITIDPPYLANSVSSLRANEGYNIEVRRTNNIQLGPDVRPPD
jgi:hypothetical protein